MPTRLVRRLLAALIALASLPAAAALSVTRDGDAVAVLAEADVEAEIALAWRVLTDYDELARFIPGMTSSRTLRRDGDHVLVEQRGHAGLGPFRQSFTLTLDVHEQPLQVVEATALAGDFERFASRSELVARDARHTRIVYRARFKPRLGIPPLVGLPLMRSAIREQFDALIVEVESRASGS